jgi:large subunit ribosomal protein L6
MSRIGKSPISLPKGVTIEVSGSNVVKVKGPKGELFQAVDPDIAVKIDNGVITVKDLRSKNATKHCTALTAH